MFHKKNRYYADWRTSTGSRKRRAFTTAKEARAFERTQKEPTKAKATRRPPRHPRSPK
jgi:hypothetical protein